MEKERPASDYESVYFLGDKGGRELRDQIATPMP
jgi:hypothetical protein